MQFNPHDHYPSADSTTPIADLLLWGKHIFIQFLSFYVCLFRIEMFSVPDINLFLVKVQLYVMIKSVPPYGLLLVFMVKVILYSLNNSEVDACNIPSPSFLFFIMI